MQQQMKLRDKLILAGVALAILLLVLTYIMRAPLKTTDLSIWQWDSVAELSLADMDAMVQKLHDEHVRTIFVRIDDYVDIVEKSNPETPEAFKSGLRNFIAKAHDKNIQVDALGGGIEWARDSHEYIPPMLIDFVSAFNKENPDAKFDGLQFDVEPYSLPDYKGQESTLLQEYWNFVEKSIEKAKEDGGIRLGFTMPPWYDGSRGDPVTVLSGGKEKPLAFAVLDALHEYGNGYVVLMSYRTKADGTNGTIAISEKVLSYADSHAAGVSVWIGQEMGKVDEAGVSFYASNRAGFSNEVKKIDDALKRYQSFAGISIDDYNSYSVFLTK